MGRLLGHRGGQSAWTASMALNSWKRAWTVLLFPRPGAWISLEPDLVLVVRIGIVTDTPGDYHDDQAGEKILEDLQPAEEEQEWRADNIE
ncbi:hypothetical protein MRB53_000056 [Persea americana]|uniref:Uncharacterized protein n=1 Tax=Persea americana TaxID=3435 RepID=A0ACC2MN36_PERAE|nr:hypothetical protein MRB53_000056 [Persea americana]